MTSLSCPATSSRRHKGFGVSSPGEINEEPPSQDQGSTCSHTGSSPEPTTPLMARTPPVLLLRLLGHQFHPNPTSSPWDGAQRADGASVEFHKQT